MFPNPEAAAFSVIVTGVTVGVGLLLLHAINVIINKEMIVVFIYFELWFKNMLVYFNSNKVSTAFLILESAFI